MAKQKRVTATVKMTYHDDSDLIAWWNKVPRGSRNAVLKDIMREYIERNRGGYRPIVPKNIPQPFDPLRFTQVCEDAAWIRTALNDLPGYVERIVQHVASMQPVMAHTGSSFTQPIKDMSDAEAVQREQKMKKSTW